MHALKTLKHTADLAGRRVLVRLDVNVPLEKHGGVYEVADTSRLEEALPTLLKLHYAGARILVAAHLGDPKGKTVARLKLHPVANALRALLPQRVSLLEVQSWDWKHIERRVNVLPAGDILILENLRFQPGEETNDLNFAKKLASLADVYVNEAFSASHRRHASLVAITKYLPSYAGWRFAEEIAALTRVRDHAKPPLVLLMGGAKVHEKTELMMTLASRASHVLVAGVIANTLFSLQGVSVGKSNVDPKPPARELRKLMKRERYERGEGRHALLQLPEDVVVQSGAKGRPRLVNIARGERLAPSERIVDIGPETIRAFSSVLKRARTIIWNGPMGLIEDRRFRHGSVTLSRVIALRCRGAAFGVVGGGESLQVLDLADREGVDFRSTGGGAMLAFLGNRRLPGLDALE